MIGFKVGALEVTHFGVFMKMCFVYLFLFCVFGKVFRDIDVGMMSLSYAVL